MKLRELINKLEAIEKEFENQSESEKLYLLAQIKDRNGVWYNFSGDQIDVGKVPGDNRMVVLQIKWPDHIAGGDLKE